MGSGDWFKNVISKKKAKDRNSTKLKEPTSEKSKVAKEEKSKKESPKPANGVSNRKQRVAVVLTEDIAATRIQTAFRAFLARKSFRNLKGILRLQALVQSQSVKKQASLTLTYLHSWSKMQAQIKDRRVCMVTEGRLRQKKIESQLKLQAKLHDLEVEWSGGSETFEEVLARIHQREEAAVKRERALAYAFTHQVNRLVDFSFYFPLIVPNEISCRNLLLQWRANSNSNFGVGSNELGKTNWGWSWMDRWIAARPWESRVMLANQSSPKKSLSKQASKTGKKTNSPKTKTPSSAKSISPHGKTSLKGRKLSYETADKAVPKGNSKAEQAVTPKGNSKAEEAATTNS
ncbi:OLC1v1021380C1 [Oldenlandia corymbosa var. corymbosa]|uniref:OLC1v1021380C1 n=1 Tax=Oldenlandia corymbosa var. corymbosa TaxID=529605 RepID=A0AAV1BXS9_OLDCO|nr:OLC1v1021380C1 [Oldenlandia corymbosa var. corymbosa]